MYLIKNYEQLNLVDETLTNQQRHKNKLELREIHMSSILLRMKANKKLQNYTQAYEDAKKVWCLMSPSERKQNSHFMQEYIHEL